MIEPQSPQANILLVEAEQETVNTLTAWLTVRGHRVRAVNKGEQALEPARDASPDLLLVSNQLPDMDARELCRRFRAVETTRTLPVPFLSDTTDPETISGLVAAGATDILVRPLQKHLLLARLEAHLELVALRNELALRDSLLESEAASWRQVEESVRLAEVSGRELVEHLSEVIYTASPDGTLTYISPGIERLLGYSPQEVIGRHVRAFVHPEAHALLTERMRRILAGHREANEYRLLTKSGETRWAHTSSQPVYAVEQVSDLQGILTDITERKHAEEQIRQQNEFLTTVLESLTHPFYVLNVHDYTIQMANSAARLGSLAGDATCHALTHRRASPCSSDEHPCPIEELKRTGKPVTAEHVHYDLQGRERFVEVHSYPLFDRQGHLVRAIEYTLDITERKQVEEALRESEARWRSVTKTSPDHVILLDADLNIQFLNYPSPGLTVQELIGTPLYAHVIEGKQHEIQGILERVLETGDPSSHETSYNTPDGDTIYYESRVVSRMVEARLLALRSMRATSPNTSRQSKR